VTVLTQQGVGSGVIYRANGVILTNDHAIRGHAIVEIAFADGRRLPGGVLAADPETDLALVKVDRTGLPAATFQGAVAIGFAIPAATAVAVANQLLSHGRVRHAFIGIQPAQLTPGARADPAHRACVGGARVCSLAWWSG
jgi:S1-C subfamily serine protease